MEKMDAIQFEKNIMKNKYANSKLKEIGEENQIHPVYFSRWFRKKYDVAFHIYKAHYRINKAMELLDHTDKKMVEIAVQCDYRNEYSFSRSFKLFTGVSPSMFRRLIREKKITSHNLTKNHILNLDRLIGLKKVITPRLKNVKRIPLTIYISGVYLSCFCGNLS